MPQDHLKRYSYATTIAAVLQNQYPNTNESGFNQCALEYLQQVLDLMSQATRADQARYGEVCAKCFLAQGNTFGSREDLDEAIECAGSSVMLTDEELEDEYTAILLERRSTWSSCYLAKCFKSREKLLDYLKHAGRDRRERYKNGLSRQRSNSKADSGAPQLSNDSKGHVRTLLYPLLLGLDLTVHAPYLNHHYNSSLAIAAPKPADLPPAPVSMVRRLLRSNPADTRIQHPPY